MYAQGLLYVVRNKEVVGKVQEHAEHQSREYRPVVDSRTIGGEQVSLEEKDHCEVKHKTDDRMSILGMWKQLAKVKAEDDDHHRNIDGG